MPTITVQALNCTTRQMETLQLALPGPVVPGTITPRQAKLALLGAGLLDAVEAAVAASSRAVQISWAEAIEFRRDDAILTALGAQLGLNATQIDQLFIQAAAL